MTARSAEISAKSAERQLELQTNVKIFDLCRDVYIDFVRANIQACDAGDRKDEADIKSTRLELLQQLALLPSSPVPKSYSPHRVLRMQSLRAMLAAAI